MLQAKAERLLLMLEAWGWTVERDTTPDGRHLVIIVRDAPMGDEILDDPDEPGPR